MAKDRRWRAVLTFQSDHSVLGSRIEQRAILGYLSGIKGSVTTCRHKHPILHLDISRGRAARWIARAQSSSITVTHAVIKSASVYWNHPIKDLRTARRGQNDMTALWFLRAVEHLGC